jgi:diaminopimelate epimerase
MKGLPFVKMHGAGNDFVLVDALKKPVKIGAALARDLCDRRFGVGADQILLLEPSKKADFRMRVLNADGSEVEMCGNGIRCAALYAFERGRAKKKEMAVETLAGIIRPALTGKDRVCVDMGEPILDAEKIPTGGHGRVIDQDFSFTLAAFGRAGERGGAVDLKITAVSMGNPHCVIFVDDLDKTPAEVWGPVIERHPFFPRRVNVEFVQVEGPDRARVRVWERGAGLTLACGTGACAVGVAGVLTGRLRRASTLALPGGALEIEWAADNRVFMTGPAAFVFDGIYQG